MIDIAELRKVAEAATPGPWKTHAIDDTSIVSADGEDVATTCDTSIVERSGAYNYERMEADAAYIAAASPDVILGLLDRLEAAERALPTLPEALVRAAQAVLASWDERGQERERFVSASESVTRHAYWSPVASLVSSDAMSGLRAALSAPVIEHDGWRPIDTCPFRTPVDLWCIYGGEEFAQYDGGASIGQLVSNRHKTEEYGFFGNQSNDGVPHGHAPDLKPVAWRLAVPQCPSVLIAAVLNIPLTRADALAASPPTPERSET